jgi:hypothetical protein
MKMKKCSKCKILFISTSTRYLCSFCNKEYNNRNKEYIKKYNKERYENNKDKILNKVKIYHSNNKEKIKEYSKTWFQENKEYINAYNRKKYNTDVAFKLKVVLRNLLLKKLKTQNVKKQTSSLKFLGCTIEQLKTYLEQQFLPEMTWKNHGEIWEIDHIKPCVSFNLTIEEEQKQCFHYSNLQPLFKTTEIAKSFGYKDQIGNRNKNKY